MSGFHAETRTRWAALPLRLILGYGFVAHGWAKLTRGPDAFAVLLHRIGTPWPAAAAWVVTLLELIGGVALLGGAFVAIVGVPLIVTMLVAMLKVHLRYGFSAIKTIGMTADGPLFGPPGYEVNLLYVAGLLALIIGGAGALSVDGWRARRREGVSTARNLPAGAEQPLSRSAPLSPGTRPASRRA